MENHKDGFLVFCIDANSYIFIFSITNLRETAKMENTKKAVQLCGFFGALQGIRTPDLLVRSQTLYPAELQAQTYLLHKLPNYNIIINIKRQAFF